MDDHYNLAFNFRQTSLYLTNCSGGAFSMSSSYLTYIKEMRHSFFCSVYKYLFVKAPFKVLGHSERVRQRTEDNQCCT